MLKLDRVRRDFKIGVGKIDLKLSTNPFGSECAEFRRLFEQRAHVDLQQDGRFATDKVAQSFEHRRCAKGMG